MKIAGWCIKHYTHKRGYIMSEGCEPPISVNIQNIFVYCMFYVIDLSNMFNLNWENND